MPGFPRLPSGASAASVGTLLVLLACGSDGPTVSDPTPREPPSDGSLARIWILPPSVELAPGAQQQFRSRGVLGNGDSVDVGVTWAASGGTITSDGLLTAGDSAGSYFVRARHADGLADSAEMTVVVPPPTPVEVGACDEPDPAWIWCDDFERDRLSSYFEYESEGDAFVREAGVGRGSSTGMRVHFEPGTVSAGALHLAFGRTPTAYMAPVDDGTADYREIYWRLYVRNEASWTGGGGDKLSRATILANSSWAQAMIAHVWSGGSDPDWNYLLLDPASGTDEGGDLKSTRYNDWSNLRWLGVARGDTPLFDDAHVGEWHCVEAQVRLNTAGSSNGVFRLWVDGHLDAERTGLNWVGAYDAYGINAVFVENYWNDGSPQAQDRFLDDFVVSTEPIGC